MTDYRDTISKNKGKRQTGAYMTSPSGGGGGGGGGGDGDLFGWGSWPSRDTETPTEEVAEEKNQKQETEEQEDTYEPEPPSREELVSTSPEVSEPEQEPQRPDPSTQIEHGSIASSVSGDTITVSMPVSNTSGSSITIDYTIQIGGNIVDEGSTTIGANNTKELEHSNQVSVQPGLEKQFTACINTSNPRY